MVNLLSSRSMSTMSKMLLSDTTSQRCQPLYSFGMVCLKEYLWKVLKPAAQ